jgi:uncharacterized membrane protein YphA (DoxX/SURF4 family)
MTAAPHAAPVTPRWADVATWALQIGLAAMYLMSAVPKFVADPAAVAGFAALGIDPTGMLLIGVLEVAGAVGLLVPRLSGLAAAGLVALMVGAVAFTVVGVGAAAALLPAVLGVLAAVVAWVRRDRTAALVGALRRR